MSGYCISCPFLTTYWLDAVKILYVALWFRTIAFIRNRAGTAIHAKGGERLPAACTFRLNSKPISVLHCEGVGDFAAFSGNDGWTKNNPATVAIPKVGPLPQGRYYIVDRGSGGFFTYIKDSIMDFWSDTERGKWFALYRDDGEVDDWTLVDGVRRIVLYTISSVTAGT